MAGALEFYTNPGQIDEHGLALGEFPHCPGSTHIWEIGSEADWRRRAWYFLLRTYSMRKSGQCLFHLHFNNNTALHDQPKLPDRAVSEFCIRTTAERIHKFGSLLRIFAKLEHQRLYWSNDEAIVDNELKNRDEYSGHPVRSAMTSLPGYIPQDVDPFVMF